MENLIIEQGGKSVSLFGPTHLRNLLKVTTLLVYLALLVNWHLRVDRLKEKTSIIILGKIKDSTQKNHSADNQRKNCDCSVQHALKSPMVSTEIFSYILWTVSFKYPIFVVVRVDQQCCPGGKCPETTQRPHAGDLQIFWLNHW